MLRWVAKAFHVAGVFLLACGVVWTTAAILAFIGSLLTGCSRPSTPAEAAPVVKPTADADECPGGVCHVPRPK